MRNRIRTALVCCAALIFLLVCFSATVAAKTDWETDDLKGKVKSVVSQNGVLSSDGKWLEALGDAEGRDYDTNGYLQQTYRVERNGSPAAGSVTAYEYSYKDGVIEKIVERRNGKVVFTLKHKYDSKGRLVKAESDGGLFRSITSFNPEKGISEMRLYASTGVLMSRLVTVFNAQGQAVSIKSYDGSGRLQDEYRFSTGAEGQVTKSKWVTPASDKKSTLVVNEEFKYDQDGLELEKTAYDEQGNVLYRMGYAYEFDSHGNWTKKILSGWVTKDGQSYFEPQSATKRTITYYE